MNQTLALTPFELMARQWQRPAAVVRVLFEPGGRAVAFRDAAGGLAVAPLADAEDTPSRLRLELDSGRMIIRPRKSEPAPLSEVPLAVDIVEGGTAAGWLVADSAGGLHRITPRGQHLRLRAGEGTVVALAARADAIALLQDDEIRLIGPDGEMRESMPLASARGLAWQGDRLFVTDAEGLLVGSGEDWLRIPLASPEDAPVPDPSGRWAAGATADGGLWLADLTEGRVAHLADFPMKPGSMGFTAGGRALVASGAYRLVAWDLSRPPFGQDRSGALRSGRTELVAVTAVAVHPTRDLVAVGRANGGLSIARPGEPEEMVLRPADGDAILALGWSADGRHVALGSQNGVAALLDLPAQLFK
ncbi:WD40 repeat domain-containing protein [Rhodobacter sp. NSM]|uniref:WD40 repeat domain-containing protein n=1 Tax=Rhodobacter sp. NSM TaxID=3457501 RepID=UPI003FD1DB35